VASADRRCHVLFPDENTPSKDEPDMKALRAIKENDLILFQGDSITNAFRSDENESDLGRGYALMTAGWLGALYPEMGVRFFNRGVSGNTVKDLKTRWKNDCLDLKPNLVSILIGINDTARRFRGAPIPAEEFEATYRDILAGTCEELGANIILCEPFLLPVNNHYPAWREELDPKIEVVRKLATDFDAVLVPLDELFAQACTRQKPEYWSWDGVHVHPSGHAIIARAWLSAVEAL
jgi:lysophospholipase L1-like esterase